MSFLDTRPTCSAQPAKRSTTSDTFARKSFGSRVWTVHLDDMSGHTPDSPNAPGKGRELNGGYA
jgi:hypothetical protein